MGKSLKENGFETKFLVVPNMVLPLIKYTGLNNFKINYLLLKINLEYFIYYF